MSDTFTAEVAVVGGGPAGLVAAIALATAGVDTLLIAPPAEPDHRTTALLAGSVTALETLGVWPACAPHAAPLRKIRLIDATQRLIRAPEVLFTAAEIDLNAFGYNIENRHLIAALEARAAALKLPRMAGAALSIASDAASITVKHANGEARVKLVIGADGRRSLCRAAAGIGTNRRTYPQTALTLNLAHARPHDDTSTEFHTESGPFTLVPLPGRRSSLVCVLDPAHAAELAAMNDAELSREIERRAHSLLGAMNVEPGRGVFPLAIETADSFARGRIALVGEAAHVVPPIGAQGLNLGLRDGATIAELVVEARRQHIDIGAPEVLARYDTQRRADVTSRAIAVDLLNRSLLTDFLPAQGARGLSLYLVDRIGLLRRALMREGVAPAASQPRLMRGETNCAVEKAKERFFYHSFPRRGVSTKAELEKGYKILACVRDFGLLLTPQLIEWNQPNLGVTPRNIPVFQKRVCFTELSPVELKEHGRKFGNFSLEFEIDTVRRLGAIPVFYVPRPAAFDAHDGSGLGTALLAIATDMRAVIQRMAILNDILFGSTPVAEKFDLNVGFAGSPEGRGSFQISRDEAKTIVAAIGHAVTPWTDLRAGADALLNFFHPTDDEKSDKLLNYYREREWRIACGFRINSGEGPHDDVLRALTPRRACPDIRCRSRIFQPKISTGIQLADMLDQALVYPALKGKRLIELVRRVIVPPEAVAAATEI